MLKALVVVLLITIGFAQTSRPLGLSYPVRSTLNEQSYDFFSIDIPLGTAPSQVLLVTVDSTQAYSQPGTPPLKQKFQFRLIRSSRHWMIMNSSVFSSPLTHVLGLTWWLGRCCMFQCIAKVYAPTLSTRRLWRYSRSSSAISIKLTSKA